MAFAPIRSPEDFIAARAGTANACWFVAAALMVFAALAGPWALGYDYVRDDLDAFHAPLRAFYAQQIARGQPFDWMPDLFCGFYLTGEGQLGGYHPLKWSLYRFLPLHGAMGVEYLLPYPLLALGAWFWLARLLRRGDAAAFGALVVGCSSFALMRLIHPHAVAVVAHLPWLLWLTELLFDARRHGRRRAAAAQAGIALLTASQLLLGYPQYVWFTWLALGFVCLCRVGSRRAFDPKVHRNTGRTCLGASAGLPWAAGLGGAVALAAAVGCGLLLAGIQLLPTVDALGESVRRSAGAEFSAAGSWHPLNAVQWIAPYLFVHRVVGENTHELAAYLGAAPLLLAVWACFSHRNDRLGRLVVAALAAALLALLAALGEFGPLHAALAKIPLLGSFRFPCRAMVLFQLAAAVLAAVGYARVFSAPPTEQCSAVNDASTKRRLPGDPRAVLTSAPMRAVVLLCGASWLVALWALVWGPAEIIGSPAAVLAGPALLSLAAGLIVAGLIGRPWAAAALALLTAADLGFSGLSYSVYAPGALARRPATPIGLPAAPARVVCDLALGQLPQRRTGNQLLAVGFSRADGYAGLEPQRPWWPWPAAFPPEAGVELLRRASVHWIRQSEEARRLGLPNAATPAADANPSFDHPIRPCSAGATVATAPPAGWLAVPDPLPKARLESPARQADESPAKPPAESPKALPAAGRVEVAFERPGQMQFHVESPAEARLVVAESWHRGWQAWVNNRPTPPAATADGFLAVDVPAGSHVVSLTFDPPSLRVGRRLSLCGVIALFALIVVGGLRRRPARQRTAPPKAPIR